jgi:NitT/TauT family transport system permease protein
MTPNSSGETARRWASIVGVHLAVVVIWYLVVEIGDIPKFVIASPQATFMSLFDTYPWFDNTLVTTIEIFGGYFLAVIVGVGLALVFSWFRAVESLLMPLVVSLNMIPKVALGPLIIVWFDYGLTTNIIIAFSISFLPILITTARGLREVEPDLIDLVKTLRATRWQIFVKIQLPGSLPYIFSGMKVAVVLAVAGAIVGEIIASDSGLAYLIGQVQVTLDTAAMMMAVLMITLVGVVLYLIVLLLERILVVRDARLETA